MVYPTKENRNELLVRKRLSNPKNWSWGKLGQHFAIHRSVAKEIFMRDLEKFANEEEIERYQKFVLKYLPGQ